MTSAQGRAETRSRRMSVRALQLLSETLALYWYFNQSQSEQLS